MTTRSSHQRSLGAARIGSAIAVAAILAVGWYAPAAAHADGARYDVAQNPFRYGGEYRDRTCGTDYLRARWYLPEQQSFLGRDPGDAVHRYGYTAGDPIGRSDPTGLYSVQELSADVGKAVHFLTPGVGAYIEPLVPFWGQALGGMQVIASLGSFWHPTADTWLNLGFAVVGVATETRNSMRGFDLRHGANGNFRRAFWARIFIDPLLGTSQSAAAAHHGSRWDPSAFAEGMSYTAGSILTGRYMVGFGYRPFGMTSEDVRGQYGMHFLTHGDDQIFVYRVRSPLPGSRRAWTSPMLEQLHAGRYHEYTIGIHRNGAVGNVLTEGSSPEVQVFSDQQSWMARPTVRNAPETFGFAGRAHVTEANAQALCASPLGYPKSLVLEAQDLEVRPTLRPIDSSVVQQPIRTGFGRPSQRHAAAVRRGLGLK